MYIGTLKGSMECYKAVASPPFLIILDQFLKPFVKGNTSAMAKLLMIIRFHSLEWGGNC